jgi:hypothetical protein
MKFWITPAWRYIRKARAWASRVAGIGLFNGTGLRLRSLSRSHPMLPMTSNLQSTTHNRRIGTTGASIIAAPAATIILPGIAGCEFGEASVEFLSDVQNAIESGIR